MFAGPFGGLLFLRSMSLFDKLAKSDPIVVRPNGDIVQCMEGFIDGFQVGAQSTLTPLSSFHRAEKSHPSTPEKLVLVG